MHADGIDRYKEEDFLALSGLQHFLFCRRQWGLIHIENLWEENLHTADGRLMHSRAHDADLTEKRGDTLICRGIQVHSYSHGIFGQCDVVEFRKDDSGVPLRGWEGRWMPFPVEYKRGEPKKNNCDAAQLCLQALCLEEMLCCSIAEGALFYGETRRRLHVAFSDELRLEVREALLEMHSLYRRGHTPKATPSRACQACSLKELCLPSLIKRRSVAAYLEESL